MRAVIRNFKVLRLQHRRLAGRRIALSGGIGSLRSSLAHGRIASLRIALAGVGAGYLDVIFYFQAAGIGLGNLLGFFLLFAAGHRAAELEILAVYHYVNVRVRELGILLQCGLHLALNIATGAGCGVALRHLGVLVSARRGALVGLSRRLG